jgi:hypothetical protein
VKGQHIWQTTYLPIKKRNTMRNQWDNNTEVTTSYKCLFDAYSLRLRT